MSSYCPADGNTLISKKNCEGCKYFAWFEGEDPQDKGNYECVYDQDKEEEEDD